MQLENRHITLLNEIILIAMQLKFTVMESRKDQYILTTIDYEKIQQIKQLVSELEELDFTS